MSVEDVLAFERKWWSRAGAREQAIRDTFGLTAVTNPQRLNRILDDPKALEVDPLTVNRLRRLRLERCRR
jgi:hypothetical protein